MSSDSTGLFGRALGYSAATIFVVASASQNALHGWQLGLRTSETTATIFAAASIAGAIMTPIALAATFRAFRNFEIVRGLVAMILAACCFCYAIVSSLGFVSGARDQAVATRSADADAYKLAKARAGAAVTELGALADAPRGNRKTEATRAQRRAELDLVIAMAEKAMGARLGAGTADPTAAALSAYAAALGHSWKPEDLSPWLSLLAIAFFEIGAAASLVVVGTPARGREPEKIEAATAPELTTEVADVAVAPEPPAGKTRGRKRAAPLEKVVDRINALGGRLEGNMESIGEQLGLSRSSARRALHALAGAGVVSLASSAAGTLVQVR